MAGQFFSILLFLTGTLVFPQCGEAQTPDPVKVPGAASPLPKPAAVPAEKPKSGSCLYFEKNQTFLAPHRLLDDFFFKKTASLLLPAKDSTCLKEGQTVSLAFAHFTWDDPVPFAYDVYVKAVVGKIATQASVFAAASQPEILKTLNFQNLEEFKDYFLTFFGFAALREPGTLVTFSFVESLGTLPFYRVPLSHPMAETVTKDQVSSLMKQQAVLIDVRSLTGRKHFTALPQSLLLTVTKKNLSQHIFSPTTARLKGLQATPEIEKIPRDRTLIVYGQNSADLAPYNAISVLNKMGFRRLLFYREGVDDWLGSKLSLPEKISGVSIYEYAQLRSLLGKAKTVVIDVRSAALFKKAKIPGSINLPFKEKKDALKHPQFRENSLTPELIRRNDQAARFSYTAPVGTENLILVGKDNFDWTPVKAAMLAQKGPSTIVGYYRQGFQEWKYLTHPKRGNAAKKKSLKSKLAAKERKLKKKKIAAEKKPLRVRPNGPYKPAGKVNSDKLVPNARVIKVIPRAVTPEPSKAVDSNPLKR